MERCFNISQFLTTTHIMSNMDHHFFLALLVNQTNRYLGPWLWMVEFSLFLIRQAYRLFGIKFKCPDYGRKYLSHPSYCCTRDDLFRTQILHNIILQIIYFTLLKVLTFPELFGRPFCISILKVLRKCLSFIRFQCILLDSGVPFSDF